MEEAHDAVQIFCTKLQKKLGVKSAWQGDMLTLERQGIEGTIVLTAGLVEVKLALGMMLTPMKGQIEAEVNKQLVRYLG
jgi:putative polyhydroxyalkanoate system protein